MISKIIFRCLLTLSSTSLIATVYFIKQEYIFYCLEKIPQFVSFLLIALLPIVFTGLSLFSKKLLFDTEIEDSPLNFEDATNSFLPSYLGYFFVALSINTDTTFWWIFSILFIFIYLSQAIYFNPILLLFNYHFYSATTSNNKKVFLILKTILSDKDDIVGLNLKSINEFTFIEQRKE